MPITSIESAATDCSHVAQTERHVTGAASVANNPRGLKSDPSTRGTAADCAPEPRCKGREIAVFVASTPRRTGRYVARLGEKGRVLCISTKPFLDAARRLMDLGFDPSATLVMHHAGSETECLRSTIGAAATLTVEDTQYGPRFRPWKPISTQAVSRRIAS